MPPLGKLLIFAGLLLIAAGLLVTFGGKLPLGRLPGDIRIERENFSFYFPFTTCVIISLLISLLLWFFRR